MAVPLQLLGVLLCYNDHDFLEDSIRYLLEQDHHLLVWDHGSTDETQEIIRQYESELLESRLIPREFDFYELYPAMSRHLIENYASTYDWISWPDQDEILEGPSRSKIYREWIEEVHASSSSWIQFNNYNYWFTSSDDAAAKSPSARIRHYSIFPDCAPRIRAWRGSATNIRIFNHNPPLGDPWPTRFNLRHYSMRSRQQMLARLFRDRVNLRRGSDNFHYENMQGVMDRLIISPDRLHYDDGRSELDPSPIFNWRSIYGFGPPSDPVS
jgi:glycosyltransferase involved in cell wall biosynthesis